MKRQVEELVGQINGAFGTRRLRRQCSTFTAMCRLNQLVALYCAGRRLLVTPLRDGMNLVAKEFVASRVDEDGVLVLERIRRRRCGARRGGRGEPIRRGCGGRWRAPSVAAVSG